MEGEQRPKVAISVRNASSRNWRETTYDLTPVNDFAERLFGKGYQGVGYKEVGQALPNASRTVSPVIQWGTREPKAVAKTHFRGYVNGSY
jgi:hypothetical protein